MTAPVGAVAPLHSKEDLMSETVILQSTETTETVQQDINTNAAYISIGLAGVFLIGILVGLFVFRVFSSRWHT